ncbi:N,N-dimethylformamidase beta subunit family domain-containing protein [Streptomyces sp. CAU 1734]|uniref:N,N-dimethylformamidase beta subunit family domain-containing protein n=1 Tax=Streptomyces sp. CAU 1734 TaxID=3140360 RepID=UPI003261C518
MHVLGYLDRLSARPGEQVRCMISTARRQRVTVDLIRLTDGGRDPGGPGFAHERVTGAGEWTPTADRQRTWPGSCMHAADVVPAGTSELTLSVLAGPTTAAAGRVQGVLGLTGESGPVATLALDELGRPCLLDGGGRPVLRLEQPLSDRRWYRLTARLTPRGSRLTSVLLPPPPARGRPAAGPAPRERAAEGPAIGVEGARDVVLAARECPHDGRRFTPRECFNGKLERPAVAGGDAPLAEWALELGPAGSRTVDVSGRERHGTLVNLPHRAVTGHNWSGRRLDFRAAPEEYGAVHFHEDDLADAGWDTSVTLTLPERLPSGVYAVRLRAGTPEGEAADHIPLIVRPAAGAEASAVLLMPTFTYLAYANERTIHEPGFVPDTGSGQRVVPGAHDRAIGEHPEIGKSLYDRHTDGSGVAHSSALRPILSMRPDYRTWMYGGPRHLSADLLLIGWLNSRLGAGFDVVCDHDLHEDPAGLLAGYRVVLTASHPEYHTTRTLDALQGHLDSGGCLAYLGGNGFYWVTTVHEESPHCIEVRRSQGVRAWEIEPGEQHHTNGEPGGLWHWRGRPPHALTGVGMSGQGWGEGRGYARTAASYRPEWSWVFDGISEETIGDFGLILGGASGDELDSHGVEHGSPADAVVLASSLPHGTAYQLAVERVWSISPDLTPTTRGEVRSDLVIRELESGGAVFSAGSISFVGSLPHNGYRNNVSRLLSNVLRNFAGRTPGGAPAARTDTHTHTHTHTDMKAGVDADVNAGTDADARRTAGAGPPLPA